MPNIKTLTKELRQEIVSYLYPLPSISSNLAFRLAIHTFTKTRFSGHINFISRCLQHIVIRKGFRSNFHASIFSNVSILKPKIPSRNSAYPGHVFTQHYEKYNQSHVLKTHKPNKQIIEFRSQLSTVCPSVLLGSIHTKIQALNSFAI